MISNRANEGSSEVTGNRVVTGAPLKGYDSEDSVSYRDGGVESGSVEYENVSKEVVNTQEPPNGGLTAWLQVLCAFMCNVNCWGIINSFGDFQEYYSRELLKHESPFRISWIGALTAAVALMGSVLSGPLVDRGFQRPMLLFAAVTESFALMMLSLCDSYWQVILCQGVLYGLAASMSFLIGMGTIAPWFSTKRPLAMGLAVLGSSVGGAIFSAAVIKMLPEIGFGWTVRVLGFIVLATGMVPVIFIKPRLPPKKAGGLFALECLEEPIFLTLCVGSLLGFSGFFQFMFYFQSWGVQAVPNSSVLDYLTAIMNAASLPGRLLPPLLVFLMGPYNANIVTYVVSGAMGFAWIGATSRGSVLAVSILFSFVTGPIFALPAIIVSMLTPDMSRIGIRLGFAFVCVGVGALIGPPFTGMLIRNYGWIYGQLYCALSWMLGAIIILVSRQFHTKGKLFLKT